MSAVSGASAKRLADVEAQNLDHVMTVLCRQVLALCAQASRAPSRVRACAGDIVLEVGWLDSPSPASPEPPATGSPATGSADLVALPSTEPDPATYQLRASTVGVFYRAPEPKGAPFVTEGNTVTVGQQVGIIEAMKLMIPVEADRDGRILEVLVADGASVEHGQPLMVLALPDADI